jgi:NAD(P)-dependent dehydrogenase (short-subunit alcohol dehydrogenase family)
VSSIIIFGGSRGIGRIIAEYYIGKKFEVSVGSRNVEALDKFRLAMARKKLSVNVIQVDITNGRDVARAFKAHVAKWGRSPDVVINCAAMQGPIGNSWSVPARKWEETIKVNLYGSFVVARAAIRQMIKSGSGSVILFSGGGAAYARPNFSAYAASKTGILRMVETMAEELKLAGYPNIIINAVAPGAVKTHMTKEVLKAGSKAGGKALGEVDEVSRTGGTPSKQITNLIDFLIDLEANCGLSGRLIHVQEDYQWLIKEFGARVPDNIGKIRRIPIQPKR